MGCKFCASTGVKFARSLEAGEIVEQLLAIERDENIKISNAEYALANALSVGETKLKTMRLVGTYDNGNFITTQPIELSMRHTNAIGGLAITNGQMTAEFDLTLRGTAPTPVTINLGILPNNGRQYSLSEIMREFDPEFMRVFTKTHDKF